MENSVRQQPRPESHSGSIELMEEKYQELQSKYKRLMQETIVANREY
jgi:hypothetical protein